MRRVPIPLGQRLADFLRGPLVLLVWLSAAGGTVWMMAQRPTPVAHVAWVPPSMTEVTAPATGSLQRLQVRLDQQVQLGEVLGWLDDAPLRARLATEMARVEQLRAELAAARTVADQDAARDQQALSLARADEERRYEADLRRYVGDEAELTLDRLALSVEVTTDQVELERIDVRLNRARGLVADGIGPEADVEDLTLLRKQVQARLQENKALLDRTRAELLGARERLATFRAQAPLDVAALPRGDTLLGLAAAAEVQARVVAEVQVLLDGLNLVAPANGQVIAVIRLEGQHVQAGGAVVRLVGAEAGEAVLYVDPAVAHEQLLGRTVELRRMGPTEVRVESKVAAVAPHVELLPERLWTSPDLPRYGRAARVPLGEPRLFLPGEVLGARILP